MGWNKFTNYQQLDHTPLINEAEAYRELFSITKFTDKI